MSAIASIAAPRALTRHRPYRYATACALAALALWSQPADAAETRRSTFAPFVGMPDLPVAGRALDQTALMLAADPDRVVLLHFFASWCEPCEEELPALTAFARRQAGDVRLVPIAVAEPASRVGKFVSRFDLPRPIVLDEDKSVTAAFKVRGLPATVAVSPRGTRALAAAGPIDWAAPQTLEALRTLKQ